MNKNRETIYRYIVRFVKDNGYPPVIREISEDCGISSTSVVAYHLDILERDGFIVRKRNKARAIKVLKK